MPGDAQRFAIQRQDGAWYAGRAQDGQAVWETDLARAWIFTEYTAALGVQHRLLREGFVVHLVGVGGEGP